MFKLIPADELRKVVNKLIERDKECKTREAMMDKLMNFPKTKEYEIIMAKMEKAVKERMFSIELDMGLGDFDYKIIKYYFTPYGYRVFLYDDNINIDWSGADFDESLLDFIK